MAVPELKVLRTAGVVGGEEEAPECEEVDAGELELEVNDLIFISFGLLLGLPDNSDRLLFAWRTLLTLVQQSLLSFLLFDCQLLLLSLNFLQKGLLSLHLFQKVGVEVDAEALGQQIKVGLETRQELEAVRWLGEEVADGLCVRWLVVDEGPPVRLSRVWENL